MNNHCKANCKNIGKCQTCGLVQDGHAEQCPLEIYDEETDWLSVYDSFLIVALVLVSAYCFGKVFGIW